MANPKKRHPRNLPGPFYVDDACITHNSCVLDAPEHFALDPATGTAYVKRQPVTPESAFGCTEARPQGTGPKTEEAGSSGKKPWWRFW